MFAVIWFCSTKFVRETLCKFMHIYAKQNVYLCNIMINRKLWGIFEVSQHSLRKRPIFLLFVFSLFLLFWCFRLKQKQKRKIRFFGCFCGYMSVFVANKVLIFSDLRLYRANYTPHPTFGTRRVGQLSSENFLFFYFLFFVKYYDFAYSAFLPNFEHFWEYHIYFSFCIKFHCIYFWLFLCVM